MAATNEVLAAAIEMHRTGRLAAAQPLYQAVLAQEHENADALHLLVFCTISKETIEGRRADQPCRGGASRRLCFHANLAEAYRVQAQFERAIGCCRMALSFSPTIPRRCAISASLQG